MSNKIYLRIGVNISRMILAFIFNISWMIVVSIILWIVYSFKIAIIYFFITFLLRPFFSHFIESREKILEKYNDAIVHNLSLFVNDKSFSIEECISTVSFFIAELIDCSMRLYLKKKDFNYLAIIISSFMVFVCYQKLILFTSSKNGAILKAKEINDNVHIEIEKNHQNINDSYKSYLKSESDKFLLLMINESHRGINTIVEIVCNIISDHLNDKSVIDVNNHIHTNIIKYLNETNTKFSLALNRRGNISSSLINHQET